MATATTTATEKCGNGITDTILGEECDDGNNLDGDGCNADCTFGNKNGCPKSLPYAINGTTSATTTTTTTTGGGGGGGGGGGTIYDMSAMLQMNSRRLLQAGTCLAVCPDRTYTDTTNYLCFPCYYTCLTCKPGDICVTCSAIDNRELSG